MFELVQNWDIQVLMWVGLFQNPILTWASAILSLLSAKAATVWLLIPVLWWRRHQALAAEIFLALSLSAFLGMCIKPLFARQRPDVIAAQMMNKPIPEFLTTHHSFPSGHVLLMAAAAYILTLRCRPSISISFWVFTILVCLARIYDKMHWPTDCIGGIVLGIVFAILSHKIWQSNLLDRIFHSKPAQAILPLKLVAWLLDRAREDDARRNGTHWPATVVEPAKQSLSR